MTTAPRAPIFGAVIVPTARPALEPTVPQMSIPGTASPDPPWEAREPSSDPDMFSILPLPDPPSVARERSWGPLRRGALHDSPQLSPQNPMMSQMREKGSSGKRQWWSSKTADCPSIDGGLLTEEGGGTAEFWRMRKLWALCARLSADLYCCIFVGSFSEPSPLSRHASVMQ